MSSPLPYSTFTMGKDQSLKEKALERLGTNPTAIGDPTSIKSETSSNVPTKDEKGAGKEKKTLKEVAQESNPSMLGDPVSLKAETADSEPTDDDRGALKKRDSKL
jgi:hypothetical protein